MSKTPKSEFMLFRCAHCRGLLHRKPGGGYQFTLACIGRKSEPVKMHATCAKEYA